MKKMRLTALPALIIVLTAGAGSSGQMDCPSITEAKLESVIGDVIKTRDNPRVPTVDVRQFHPVCLAHSQERDRYRYVSVVVEYTCIGNDNCRSGPVVEQFDSDCEIGDWYHRISGLGTNVRTLNPLANFSTTTREDCVFCLSPATAAAFELTTDTVTHCVACDSSCSEGLMRCYERDHTDCCHYYNASTCVYTCPSLHIPDDEYNCVCSSNSTSDSCSQLIEECNVTNCNRCYSDSTICDVCADGYLLSNNECRRDSQSGNGLRPEVIIGIACGSAASILIIIVIIAIIAIEAVFSNRGTYKPRKAEEKGETRKKVDKAERSREPQA